jgi:carboxypeptidase Taq
MNPKLQKYYAHLKEVSTLQSALSLLQWDQEVNLPIKASKSRAEQVALLSGIIHKKFIDKEFVKLTHSLSSEESLTDYQKKSVQKTLNSINKNLKLTVDFVELVSTVTSKVFFSWIQSRKDNDASSYLKELVKLIEIKKQEVEIKYPHIETYNGFLDEHDEGTNMKFLDQIFDELLPGIDKIIAKLNSKEQENEFLFRHYPSNKQWEFGLRMLNVCGFDFKAGRQDKSEHPFTIALGHNDIRITTRINENYFPEMFWSSMHELGHALYEQGLEKKHEGAPESEACSISIHESQSRFWENHIGRSEAFIQMIFPILKEKFPKQLEDISPLRLYKAVNQIKPTLIRTSADELTYHKHIYIRYQLEKDLFSGHLKPKELREAWNEMYKQHLGVFVDSDVNGILQDVHWAHGSFGYFPTYTLGSLYAARFNNHMRNQIPEAFDPLREQSFSLINSWLKQNVYISGRLFDSDELCRKSTGTSLSAKDFLNYAHEKYTNHSEKIK